MKHAILILAHKDWEQTARLVRYFSKNCKVYLHFDNKFPLPGEALRVLWSFSQTQGIYQEKNVHWGGFSLLETELYLLSQAYADNEADYFHLLSGQDYPIVSLARFLHFFESSLPANYLDCKPWQLSEWKDERFDRYRYFFPYDEVDARTAIGNTYIQERLRVQINNGEQRPPFTMFDTIFKGSQWFSVTRDAVRYVLEFSSRHPDFLLRLKDTFAPEETYINTILCNRPDLFRIESHNLRFILWTGENGNNPSHLSLKHFADLAASDALFARKMVYPLCTELIDKIDHQLLES